MKDFFKNNGTKNDTWGGCYTGREGHPECVNYMEENATALDVDGIIIYEPCNYVSNVAYYRVVKQIADRKNWSMGAENQKALKQAFATLGMGSSFWHGSHTFLGHVYDN